MEQHDEQFQTVTPAEANSAWKADTTFMRRNATGSRANTAPVVLVLLVCAAISLGLKPDFWSWATAGLAVAYVAVLAAILIPVYRSWKRNAVPAYYTEMKTNKP